MIKAILLLTIIVFLPSCTKASIKKSAPLQNYRQNPDLVLIYIEERGLFFDSYPKEKLSYSDFANQRCKIRKSVPYEHFEVGKKIGWSILGLVPVTQISRELKVWCQV